MNVDEPKSRAVIAYLWSGGRPFPYPNDQGVVDMFGLEEGEKLLAYAKMVTHEMNDAPINHPLLTVDSAGRLYTDYVRERHPELSAESVEMLRRAYTYLFWFR